MKGVKQMKKRKIHVFPIVLIIVLVLLALEYFGINGSEVSVYVEPGMNSSQIYSEMKKNGVIVSTKLFAFAAKGDSQNFKAGMHTMNKHMSYKKAIEELKRNAAGEGEVLVTFPEGYELREMAQLLEDKGIKKADDFIKASNEKYECSFLPSRKDGYLEGYLFPDSYYISAKMKSSDIINMMLKRFGEVYTDAYKKRADEIGMTTNEVITLASIIEREAARDSERALVSSVFHNRLKSSEYPYLQSCATVQYLLSERKEVLSDKDIEIDSPYNTYKYKGLPPGPIASPGRKSIEAALYPAQTNYYFFVSNGDGTQTFSETYEEHMNSGVNKK